MNLRIKVSDILRQLGVPTNLKGFQYARYAIELCVNNEDIRNGSIVHTLYPAVAEQYNTTSSKVERAIRHAIETAWSRGDIDIQEAYFGSSIDPNKGKPTNSEFIATITDIIILEENI